MLPSVTARWEGAIGSGGRGRDPAGATDSMIAARQRVRQALAEVGQDFADLLVDLCGFLKGLETIERERRWPARSAKVVVRLALRRLAEHYGLETEARGPERSRGVRTWFRVSDNSHGRAPDSHLREEPARPNGSWLCPIGPQRRLTNGFTQARDGCDRRDSSLCGYRGRRPCITSPSTGNGRRPA
jgi:hypothetical protein